MATFKTRELEGAPSPFVVYEFNKRGKVKHAYSFRTAEARQSYMDRVVAGEVARKERAAERAAVKRAERAAMVNTYEVGDVLCNSWGWEQTNVDFLQVVSKTARTVTLRRIAAETVSGSEGFMSSRVRPLAGQFLDEARYPAFRKTLQPAGLGQDPYVPSRHGYTHRYEDGAKGTYCSWYA